MTAEQRWILDLTEVLTIRLECTRCNTAVVMAPLDWRDSLSQCPACGNFWDRPHVSGEEQGPLYRFGAGLRLLLQQERVMAKSGGQSPYRVKLEINDPTTSRYS